MQKVFYELKFAGKLPSPAGIGLQILQLTSREDCSLDEITRVVRSDPSLTGRILKAANPFARGVNEPRMPLEEAVLRIGLRAVRELVLGFSLISNTRSGGCRAFDYNSFWHLSLGRAVAAQHLTEVSGRESGSQSYVCGLLCGIGRLALACAHPGPYSEILEKGITDPEALALQETRRFGIDHRELTEALLTDWGFPRRLAHAVAKYQQVDPFAERDNDHACWLGETLRLAEAIATALSANGEALRAAFDNVQRGLIQHGIPDTEVGSALSLIQKTWREWGSLLDIPEPGAARERARLKLNGIPDGLEPDGVESAPSTNGNGSVHADAEPGTVLLLEAEHDCDDTLTGWLAESGQEVIRAKSVAEALQVAVAASPAIVIAHGGRDDSEAMKLCRALRKFEAGRNAYFILATTEREPSDLMALLDEGVDDYLTLPCTAGAGLVRIRAAQRLLELRARLAAQEKVLEEHLAELAVANRKLHRAAMTDELTQLPNRRFAEESLREEWEAATAQDEDLSLIFADIDHFKRVNDAYGHLVGDMVLAAVARVFRRELRSSDVACRLGGEEFLVICPRTNLEGARSCAERLRERVASQMIEVAGTKHRVTLSLGIATRRNGKTLVRSMDALFQAADDAVYAAKRSGRNRVSVGFAPALDSSEMPAVRRPQLSSLGA